MANNIFYSLSYTHEEIELLLRKIATGNVLQAADYDKLVNIIGIDNISTFSGNYNDLQNTPNIPYWMSDLKDDLGLATVDNVNQKIDATYDRLVTLINEYENENEGIFANQADLDIQLQNLSWSLREYVEQQIAQLPLSGYATKVQLAGKSDIGHNHKTYEIDGLNDELNKKAHIDHTHDLRYASKLTEHMHTDLDALNNITQDQIDYWNEHVDSLSEDIAIINNRLDEDLSDENRTAQWQVLHEIAHDNLEVLNGISDAKIELWDSVASLSENVEIINNRLDEDLSDENRATQWSILHEIAHENLEALNRITNEKIELWDGIDYLEFKTEKAPITTQAVGGLDKGSDISGYSIHMLLERILLPDIKPEATMTVNKNKPGVIFEKGEAVIINNITINITLGSNPIETVTLFVDGVQEQVQNPIDSGESLTIVFPISKNNEIKSSIAQGKYSVKITDTKGYNITINSPAINFYYPCYYGVVNKDVTIDAAQIIAMNKDVGAKGNKTFTYNTNNQRMVFAYPASYGLLTSILDLNGFEQIKAFERTSITINTIDGDQQYYVYMNNANTNTNFKMTYKF